MRAESAQAPLVTATVDDATATIRARGHIDWLGADVLRGTVESLQRRGHRHVTLQIAPLARADPEARLLLRSLATELSARETELSVC